MTSYSLYSPSQSYHNNRHDVIDDKRNVTILFGSLPCCIVGQPNFVIISRDKNGKSGDAHWPCRASRHALSGDLTRWWYAQTLQKYLLKDMLSVLGCDSLSIHIVIYSFEKQTHVWSLSPKSSSLRIDDNKKIIIHHLFKVTLLY